MKKLILIFTNFLIVITIWAQTPQKMSYQAVIRNSSNALVVSGTVGMRISILHGSSSGSAVYTETQTPTTNANGLVSIEIGISAGFSDINWADGLYYIKTETDPRGGTNYTITGVSQLLSVPYAFYAKVSGSSEQGVKGDQGIQGLKGDKGDQGIQGADGLTTSVNGVTQINGAITLTKANINMTNVDNTSDANKPVSNATQTALNLKVDKITGKGLSTNDYTTVEQTKLAGIAAGAEVNVNADWNAATGDAQILNKPTIPSAANGSETKVTAGTNVTITGIGTSASPYIINTVPNLTQAQIKALTPLEGLIVYNSTTKKPNYYNGIEWMNYDGTVAVNPIGDTYQGGKIAYIFQVGDPGYVAGQTHGLIAAIADQGIASTWYNGTYLGSGATNTTLGSGSANTKTIITTQGNTGTYAAKLCRDYSGGGYNDWYLPSKDELNKLYLNQVAIGGFVNATYWSSSEVYSHTAYAQDFSDGSEYIYDKYYNFRVRAVRIF